MMEPRKCSLGIHRRKMEVLWAFMSLKVCRKHTGAPGQSCIHPALWFLLSPSNGDNRQKTGRESMACPWTEVTGTARNPFVILIPRESLLKWFLCTKETSRLWGNNLFTLEPSALIKLWLKASFRQPAPPYEDNSPGLIRLWGMSLIPWTLTGCPPRTADREHTVLVLGNHREGNAQGGVSWGETWELLHRMSFSSPTWSGLRPSRHSILYTSERPIVHWWKRGEKKSCL